jgi:SAM-dependent methyltransferase
MQQNWYESWFDSTYYHLLYKHRNEEEAENFLSRLLDRIHLPAPSNVLDLACGKGRHSRYLHQCGHDVTGVDLSPENIKYCRQFENERLHFFEHDMRRVLRINYFDAVFNLFTSFGYFDRPSENERVIISAASALQKGGYFIIDFLNAAFIMQHLTESQELEREGVHFRISRQISDNKIIKKIDILDGEIRQTFREEVGLILPDQFKQWFAKAGLTVLNTYGDYHLGDYHSDSSQRLIFITRKL